MPAALASEVGEKALAREIVAIDDLLLAATLEAYMLPPYMLVRLLE